MELHAIRVLEEDHERINALLEELSEAEAGEARRRLFERLAEDLSVHLTAEDNIFLPQTADAIEDSERATRSFFDESAGVLREASGLIAASRENHAGITALLQEMDGGGRRDEEIEKLREAMARQIEIERRLFPKTEAVLEEEDFERIGDLIEHCKVQVRGLAQARLASSSGPA